MYIFLYSIIYFRTCIYISIFTTIITYIFYNPFFRTSIRFFFLFNTRKRCIIRYIIKIVWFFLNYIFSIGYIISYIFSISFSYIFWVFYNVLIYLIIFGKIRETLFVILKELVKNFFIIIFGIICLFLIIL